MSDSDPKLEQSKLLLERAKFFREHVQAVLNLATGSFVLSVTFLHDKAAVLQHKSDLSTSWWLMAFTILLGIAYNYSLSIYVRNEGVRYGGLLKLLSLMFHLLFVISMCFLLRFGLWNV